MKTVEQGGDGDYGGGGVRSVEELNMEEWIGRGWKREAYRQRKSGMKTKDIESEAHKLYEQDKRNKFIDYVVFDEKVGLTARPRHKTFSS
ncbi:hypothetical protein R6Q59_003062 [Mikania micrantha]